MGGIRGLPWLVLSVQPESAQLAYVVRSSLLNRSAANELRKACDTCDTFSLGLVRRSSARVSLIRTCASHVSLYKCPRKIFENNDKTRTIGRGTPLRVPLCC